MHLRQHEKAGETDANAKIVDLTPNEKLTVAEVNVLLSTDDNKAWLMFVHTYCHAVLFK